MVGGGGYDAREPHQRVVWAKDGKREGVVWRSRRRRKLNILIVDADPDQQYFVVATLDQMFL